MLFLVFSVCAFTIAAVSDARHKRGRVTTEALRQGQTQVGFLRHSGSEVHSWRMKVAADADREGFKHLNK